MSQYALPFHQHGKSKVRVGRVWRDGNVHHMVEWNVNVMLESDMEHAYLNGDNTGMTATDTQKNTVRLVQQTPDCNPYLFLLSACTPSAML